MFDLSWAIEKCPSSGSRLLNGGGSRSGSQWSGIMLLLHRIVFLDDAEQVVSIPFDLPIENPYRG